MQHAPKPSDLPSSAKLIKSTIVAAVAAALLLVATILPAEYGIDPTGVGQVLGLTKMGEIKTSLAKEAAAQNSAEPATLQPVQPIQDGVPKQLEKVTALRTESVEPVLASSEGKNNNLTVEDIKASLAQEAGQGEVTPATKRPVQPVQDVVPKEVGKVATLRKDSREISLAP